MTRPVIGLALGAGRAVAWWPAASDAAGRTESFTLDAGALAGGDADALGALMRLPGEAARGRVLHVALAAPWSTPRIVELPPMREDEARRALARDAARWFPRRRDRAAVVARRLGGPRWFVADADDAVLDAITRAARQAGCSAVRIVPAGAALATVAGGASTAFVMDDEAIVLAAHDGLVTTLRRCRTADLPPGLRVHPDGLETAARHVVSCTDREFVSTRIAAARALAAQGAARRLMAVAAIAAAAALAVRVWGASHHVAQLQARRAALKPALAPYLAARDSLTDALDALSLLRRASAPVWRARFGTIAAALPAGTTVTSLRGDADSVRIEGTSINAAQALSQLRRARGVARVDDHTTTEPSPGGGAFAATIVFGAERAP